MNYAILDSTKLNTRYSELMRATPGSVERLVQERHGETVSFSSPIMAFGTLRHDMFEQESRETGKLPACFGIDEPVDAIEQEYIIEIARDAIIYLRPDAVWTAGHVINDYKTGTLKPGQSVKGAAKRLYASSMQLPVYAYCLTVHGIVTKTRRYLVEFWDEAREHILGYDVYEAPVTIADLAGAKSWLKTRVELLQFAERQYELNQGTI